MRLMFFLFLILMISQYGLAEIKPSPAWVSKGQLGDVKVYAKGSFTLTVTDGTTPVTRKLDPSNFKSEISASLAARKKSAVILGKKMWTAEPVSLENYQGRQIVTVQGSFQDQGQKFQFIEFQVFKGNQYSSFELETDKGETALFSEQTELKKWIWSL